MRRLLTIHAPRVVGALHREFAGVLDCTAIEEAISAAAHRAWLSIETYDENRGSLEGWFFVIARHSARRVLARDGRQRPPREVGDPERVFDTAAFERAVAEPSSLAAAVRSCIEALPRLQRAIVEADLAAGGIANAAALAAELGTTRNSIYVSRALAHRALREAMRASGHFDDAVGRLGGAS